MKTIGVRETNEQTANGPLGPIDRRSSDTERSMRETVHWLYARATFAAKSSPTRKRF